MKDLHLQLTKTPSHY